MAKIANWFMLYLKAKRAKCSFGLDLVPTVLYSRICYNTHLCLIKAITGQRNCGCDIQQRWELLHSPARLPSKNLTGTHKMCCFFGCKQGRGRLPHGMDDTGESTKRCGRKGIQATDSSRCNFDVRAPCMRSFEE